MSKHTPGKCTCKVLCDADGFYQDDEGVFCGSIAFCPLHTAAPELLRALKDVSDSLDSLYKHEPGVAGAYFGAALDGRIKYAIAKAEGRV